MANHLNLEDFRNQVDDVNLEILYLLKRRAQISKKITKWKFENNGTLESVKRDGEILKKTSKLATSLDLDGTYILKVFELVIDNSNQIQDKEFKKLEEKN